MPDLLRPGRTLTGRLPFVWKFTGLALVLLLPLGLVTRAYFGEKGSQISFSSDERRGVVYLRPVTAVLHEVVAARSAAVRSDAAGAASHLEAARRAMDDVARAEDRLGRRLGSHQQYDQVVRALAAVPAGATGEQ